MKFSFKEVVKLSTKGIKPNDIAELTALDEGKFDKDDILSLVNSGYSTADIKQLVDTFTSDESDEGESAADTAPASPDDTGDTKTPTGDNTPPASDNIDYKSLYENEKKLREKLQHQNATEKQGSVDTRTSEQVAIDVTKSILGG